MTRSPIDLIAIDLDGTLYDLSLVISERNKAAIAAARDRGVRVTLATGRVVYDVADRAHELGLLPPHLPETQVTPIISYQGGVIYDLLQERPLLVQHLDAEVAVRAIEYARQRGQSVNLHTVDATYRENATEYDTFYAEKSRLVQPLDVDDLVATIRNQPLEPLKLVLVTPEAETVGLVAALRDALGDSAEVTRSHPNFTEVTSKLATKGNALAFLCERLNIPAANVMAIGDNWNDISMLKWAGHGVAMGHADATVQAAARYVTTSLADDGVAAAIERLVLEQS